MPIARLSDSVIKTLNSGQVCSDVVSIVKELLENALDAFATNIHLDLDGAGLDHISITDNGKGIPFEDREHVTKRHYTSKLSSFEDLGSVRSYGFRGEALASLVDISESFMLTTRTETDEIAVQYAFDSRGQWGIVKSTADTKGTSISAKKLFHAMPVRRQKFKKDAHKILPALRRVFATYHFIRPQARMSLIFRSGNKGECPTSLILPSRKCEVDAVMHSFGRNIKQCIETTCQLNGYELHPIMPDPAKPVSWLKKGFYFYVDDRPMQCLRGIPARVRGLVQNKIVETIPTIGTDPFAFLSIRCPSDSYDPNIEPSKCIVLMEDPNNLIEAIEILLRNLYTSDDSSMLTQDSTKAEEMQILDAPRSTQISKNFEKAQQSGDDIRDSFDDIYTSQHRPSSTAAIVASDIVVPKFSDPTSVTGTRNDSWVFSMLDQLSSEDDHNTSMPPRAAIRSALSQARSRSTSVASDADYVLEQPQLTNPWTMAKLVSNKTKGRHISQSAGIKLPESSDSMQLDSAFSQESADFRGGKRPCRTHVSVPYLPIGRSHLSEKQNDHNLSASRRVRRRSSLAGEQCAVQSTKQRHKSREGRIQPGIDGYLRPSSSHKPVSAPHRLKRKMYTAPLSMNQQDASSVASLDIQIAKSRANSNAVFEELRDNMGQFSTKSASTCSALERKALERRQKSDQIHNISTTLKSDYFRETIKTNLGTYDVFNRLESFKDELISGIERITPLTTRPLDGNICLLKVDQNLGTVALLAGSFDLCEHLEDALDSEKLISISEETKLVRIW